MATYLMDEVNPCECAATRENLIPIPVGGPLTKFQVCPKCGTIWIERYRTPEGRPESVVDVDMEDDLVPGAVREKARVLVGPLPRHSRRSLRERMLV